MIETNAILTAKVQAAEIPLNQRRQMMEACLNKTNENSYKLLDFIEAMYPDTKDIIRLLKQDIHTCYSCFDGLSREIDIALDKITKP